MIKINNLQQEFRIGVSAEEKSHPQKLSLDIEIELSDNSAYLSDDLNDTLDYVEVCAWIKKLAESKQWNLLEKLVYDIATGLLEQFSLSNKVKVEVKKFILPQTDSVSVVYSAER